jgi:hypothetical protein
MHPIAGFQAHGGVGDKGKELVRSPRGPVTTSDRYLFQVQLATDLDLPFLSREPGISLLQQDAARALNVSQTRSRLCDGVAVGQMATCIANPLSCNEA